MACGAINTSLPRNCTNKPGGVNRLLLANYENILSWTAAGAGDDWHYDSMDFGEVALTAVTLANPAVATTATAHGLNSGPALIFGTSPMDGLVGNHNITVLSSTTFEIDDFDSTALAAFGASAVSVYGEGGAWMEIKSPKGIFSTETPFTKGEGASYNEPTVSGKYQGSSKAVVDFFQDLQSSTVVALTISADGLRKIFGLENGLEIDVLLYKDGPGPGDANGFEFTLKGAEEFKYRLLDPSFAIPVFAP